MSMCEGDDVEPANSELSLTYSDESTLAVSAWLPRVSGRPAALQRLCQRTWARDNSSKCQGQITIDVVRR
jgi:hypothetical protein